MMESRAYYLKTVATKFGPGEYSGNAALALIAGRNRLEDFCYENGSVLVRATCRVSTQMAQVLDESFAYPVYKYVPQYWVHGEAYAGVSLEDYRVVSHWAQSYNKGERPLARLRVPRIPRDWTASLG